MSRVLGVLALLVPALAWAGPKRDAVMDLLNAIEEPVREADLTALGDGVDAELMSIADDAAIPVSRRGRAVSALQYFKTEPVRVFLEGHLAAGDALVRRKAAYSLAVFGPSAVAPLSKALGDADVQLRIAAAQALGQLGDAAAHQALTARLGSEREPAVRDAITKALNSPLDRSGLN
ncbi:MAG: HEAT repeat domain-containing protein [Myxococcota bacterium]